MCAFRESATAHFSFVASKLYLTGDMIACLDVSVISTPGSALVVEGAHYCLCIWHFLQVHASKV